MNNRRNVVDYILVLLVAAGTSIAVTVVMRSPGAESLPHESLPVPEESAYERILEQGTIRVGYVPYPPGCIKDPNTGKLSGVFVETLEQAASNMDLKIQWAEEVGWGSMIEGLRANRYDLIGSPVWANSTRGKFVTFTVPLFYSGIGAYVRATDDRFVEDLSSIDSETVRISTIDGEMSDIISRQQFARAVRVSLPQLSDNSLLLLNVVEGKADVAFVEPYIAQLFLQNNPGTLKNIAHQHPLRIFPNTMMLRKEDFRLKSMLDTALIELLNSGFVDELLRGYSPDSGAFYPVAFPYRLDSPAIR